MDDEDLQQLADLHDALENEQSALAVRLELERRRQQQTEQLTAALAPYVAQDPALVGDLEELYRKLNGPAAIEIVTRDERRNIQLEAARHFGFTRLREGQTETIAAILRQESILAVMPTGAGKSLCYQLPAFILPKPTLVISPLIALDERPGGKPARGRTSPGNLYQQHPHRDRTGLAFGRGRPRRLQAYLCCS